MKRPIVSANGIDTLFWSLLVKADRHRYPPPQNCWPANSLSQSSLRPIVRNNIHRSNLPQGYLRTDNLLCWSNESCRSSRYLSMAERHHPIVSTIGFDIYHVIYHPSDIDPMAYRNFSQTSLVWESVVTDLKISILCGGVVRIVCEVQQGMWMAWCGRWIYVTYTHATRDAAHTHHKHARAVSRDTWVCGVLGVVVNKPLIPWMIGCLIGYWINNRLENMGINTYRSLEEN